MPAWQGDTKGKRDGAGCSPGWWAGAWSKGVPMLAWGKWLCGLGVAGMIGMLASVAGVPNPFATEPIWWHDCFYGCAGLAVIGTLLLVGGVLFPQHRRIVVRGGGELIVSASVLDKNTTFEIEQGTVVRIEGGSYK